MGLFAVPAILLIYWILDKIEVQQAHKQYCEYQEELKRLGLKHDEKY